jgi:hypothetical protein
VPGFEGGRGCGVEYQRGCKSFKKNGDEREKMRMKVADVSMFGTFGNAKCTF